MRLLRFEGGAAGVLDAAPLADASEMGIVGTKSTSELRAPAGGSCASASANADAEENRSAGCLASARSITTSSAGDTVERSRRALGTGSDKRLAMTACSVRPTYGGSPVSIS